MNVDDFDDTFEFLTAPPFLKTLAGQTWGWLYNTDFPFVEYSYEKGVTIVFNAD